jgi:hypothetical protein
MAKAKNSTVAKIKMMSNMFVSLRRFPLAIVQVPFLGPRQLELVLTEVVRI